MNIGGAPGGGPEKKKTKELIKIHPMPLGHHMM